MPDRRNPRSTLIRPRKEPNIYRPDSDRGRNLRQNHCACKRQLADHAAAQDKAPLIRTGHLARPAVSPAGQAPRTRPGRLRQHFEPVPAGGWNPPSGNRSNSLVFKPRSTLQVLSIFLSSSSSSRRRGLPSSSRSILRIAWSTVVWSRLPKRRPISGSERAVNCFARYMPI